MKNIRERFRQLWRFMILPCGLLIFMPVMSLADNVMQMNLGEMIERSDKVFRGIVIAAIPGHVKVGGGELPVLTYRIRVDESFKGSYKEIKGVRFTEVRMLSGPQDDLPGSTALFSIVPRLEVGSTYLLLTTRPSAVGLSAPVGLGQGYFRIHRSGHLETAVNENGNRMLFRGMRTLEWLSSRTNSYPRMAAIIRRLAQGEGKK